MADITRVTAAEFDQLTAHDKRRFELINGEVIEIDIDLSKYLTELQHPIGRA